MTDEVVERIADALYEGPTSTPASIETPEDFVTREVAARHLAIARAKRVLAALRPGDVVGVQEDVVVTKSFAESISASQAAEATREACANEFDLLLREWLASDEKEASFDDMIAQVRTLDLTKIVGDD